MTQDLQPLPKQTQDALATAVLQLTHSLRLPLDTAKARNELAAQANRLSAPAPGDWLAARVASLLSPYYEKDTPQGVRVMEAEDWIASLSGSPRWAVDAAARWWKGAENERRHRRPMEGDIAARVAIEMDAVRAARIKIAAFDAKLAALPKPQEPERTPVTAERAAEIMAAAGFAPGYVPKSFPGGNILID